MPSLRRYAIALVGNVAVADDLVQDCIERAINKSSQLREKARLQGWLRRILYNLYMDEIHRTRGRGVEVQISDFADDLQLSTAPSHRTATADLIRAVNKLNPEHRQILLLVGLEQLNYRELAEELAVPIGTVMSRLARAREQLRAELEEMSTSKNVVLFRTDKRASHE